MKLCLRRLWYTLQILSFIELANIIGFVDIVYAIIVKTIRLGKENE